MRWTLRRSPAIELPQVDVFEDRRATAAGVHRDRRSRRPPARSRRTAAGGARRSIAAERPVVLAGPGVVLHDAVEGLRAFAAAGERRRAQHLGRQGRVRLAEPAPPGHRRAPGVGLRAGRAGRRRPDHRRPGLDEREVLADWRLAPVVDVAPTSLASLAERDRAARARDRGAAAPRRPGRRHARRAGTRTDGPAAADEGDAALQPGAGRRGPGRRRSRHGRLLGRPHVRRPSTSAAPRSPPTGTPTGSRSPAPRWRGSPTPTAPCWRWWTSSTARRCRRSRPPPASGSPYPSRCGAPTAPPSAPTPTRLGSARLVRDGRQAAIATDPCQLDEMLAVAGPIVAWTAERAAPTYQMSSPRVSASAPPSMKST